MCGLGRFLLKLNLSADIEHDSTAAQAKQEGLWDQVASLCYSAGLIQFRVTFPPRSSSQRIERGDKLGTWLFSSLLELMKLQSVCITRYFSCRLEARGA